MSSGLRKVTLDSISSGCRVGPSSVGVKNRRVLHPLEVGSVFTCGFCCLPRAITDLCSSSNPQLRGLHIRFLFLEKTDTVDHFPASFLILCSYQCRPTHHPTLGLKTDPSYVPLDPSGPTFSRASLDHEIPVSCICLFSVSSLSGLLRLIPSGGPPPGSSWAAILDPREGADSICTDLGHSPSCQDIVPNILPGCFFSLFLSENSHLERLKWAS